MICVLVKIMQIVPIATLNFLWCSLFTQAPMSSAALSSVDGMTKPRSRARPEAATPIQPTFKGAAATDYINRAEVYRGTMSVVWHAMCKRTRQSVMLKAYLLGTTDEKVTPRSHLGLRRIQVPWWHRRPHRRACTSTTCAASSVLHALLNHHFDQINERHLILLPSVERSGHRRRPARGPAAAVTGRRGGRGAAAGGVRGR